MTNNPTFPKEEGAEIRTATEEALALATHPKPKRGRKAAGPVVTTLTKSGRPRKKPQRDPERAKWVAQYDNRKKSQAIVDKFLETKFASVIDDHLDVIQAAINRRRTPPLPFQPVQNNENDGCAEAAQGGEK